MNDRPSQPATSLGILIPGSHPPVTPVCPACPPPAFVPSSPPLDTFSPGGFSGEPQPMWMSPEEGERRSFRRTLSAAGFALFSSPVLQLGLSLLVSYLIVFLHNTFGLIEGITNNGLQVLVTGIVYPLSYIFPILLLRVLLRTPFSRLLGFGSTRPLYLLTAPGMVLGVSVLGVLADTVLTSLTAALGWVSYSSTLQPASFEAGDLIVYIVVLSVFPALLEEFFFRGALLTMLRRFGDGFAILTTSVAFALIHGNLEQMPSALFTGLVLGLVTVKSGSVWPAVLAHFANNYISTLTNLWFAVLPDETAVLYSLLMYLVFLALGFAAFWLTARRDASFSSLPRPATLTTGGQKLGMIFARPGVLLFVSVCLLLTVQSFQQVR